MYSAVVDVKALSVAQCISLKVEYPMGKFGSQKGTVNLASFNFSGLAGDVHIKQHALESGSTVGYWLGSCGPPEFYGTLGGCFSFFSLG